MNRNYRCELSANGCSCKVDDYTCGGEAIFNKQNNVYNVWFFHNSEDEVKKARCPKSKLLTKFFSSNGKADIDIDFIAEGSNE